MTLSGPTELAQNPARFVASKTRLGFLCVSRALATIREQPSLSASLPSSRVQPWCEAQPLARRIQPSGRHLAERG